METWIESKLRLLTLEEKARLLAGRDLWHTVPIERVGIPALKLSDGPRGARGADGNHGPTSTSFPCGSAMGATWDPGLIEQVGRALAHETVSKGAHVLLGPTVNIPRVPNAGRNFECFSEDPILSGVLAAAWVSGIQSEGVAACIKHFVCNDQEQDRYDVDAVVDERTLREIYLEPFRIAIEEAKPWALMSAYNSINGTTASEHPMLEEMLRDEFGFDGLVMSDWYGTYGSGVITSGLDLEMPGPGRWLGAEAVRAAVESGEASEGHIDRKVERLLSLVERTAAADRQGVVERADERPKDRELARRVAVGSMVLLTNDGTLPLQEPRRIAVVGELAQDTPHQGGGSSSVNPHRAVSILEGIRSAVGPDVEVTWTAGCEVRRVPRPIDPACLGGSGLLVEYFAGPQPEGDAVRAVTSTRSWLSLFGTGDEWVDYDRFSVRMTGRFVARASGTHVFHIAAAGRLRARVGSELAIDAWFEALPGGATSSIELDAGEAIDLLVEYASMEGERWRFLTIGCREPGPEVSVEAAAAAAADADLVVVVAGLSDQWESEGFDRPNLALPGRQDDLITAVAARQPRTVVVLTAGAPVEMPWLSDVSAVIQAWYGGQEVGHAVADVLFGHADPGGRLPVTFPMDSRQHPGLLNYPGVNGKVRYGEGVYVGYRGYDRLGLQPLFPFGYGLSYSTFRAEVGSVGRTGDDLVVEVEVMNIGERLGTEVVQLYVRDVGGIERKLAGFSKVELEGHAAETVRIVVPISRLRWWDPASEDWRPCTGTVALDVAGSFGVLGAEAAITPS